MKALLLLIALLAGGAPIRSAEPPRPLAPLIQSIFPRGARQGSTTTVSIRGRYLGGSTKLQISGAGVSAQILENTDSAIQARFSVESDAPVGQRDVRVVTPQGTFVQVFEVSALPEHTEREPNDEPGRAESLQLPVIVNGAIPAGDYDHFRFHAAAGQVLTFDLSSSRVGTRFDAAIWLLDERGRELAFADDSYFDKDPRLVYSVTRSGEYVLRASGFRESGSPFSEYRLVMGDVPVISHVFPAGAQRGARTQVSIFGTNLARVDGVTLDGISVPVEIRGQTPERIDVQVSPASSVEPAVYALRLRHRQQPFPASVPFVISAYSEITLPQDVVSMPLDVRSPVVINGSLRQRGQTHSFLIDVEAGYQLELKGDAMSLGNFLDPAVTIYDAHGEVVSYMDEAAPNGFDKEPTTVDFRLTHTFEKAGTYRVELRDAALRGREDFIYRLFAATARPAFTAHTLTNQVSAVAGQTATLPVRVRRAGGWDTPVEVWVEGLPPRVESKRIMVDPANTRFRGTFSEDFFFDGTNVELPLQVHEGASPGSYPLRVRARGMAKGETRETVADVHYPWQQTGYLRGRSHDQQMMLTIAKAPLFDVEGPSSLQLAVDKSVEVSLFIRWLGQVRPPGSLRIEAGRMPVGVAMERQQITPEGDRATVTLRSSRVSDEPTGWLSLAAVLQTGEETYRKAAPDIEVKFVQPAAAHEAGAQ